jgi:hypothetical protein
MLLETYQVDGSRGTVGAWFTNWYGKIRWDEVVERVEFRRTWEAHLLEMMGREPGGGSRFREAKDPRTSPIILATVTECRRDTEVKKNNN